MIVLQHQMMLKALGYEPGNRGVVCEKTVAALRRFQEEHGLEITDTFNWLTVNRLRHHYINNRF